jgi:hypothetical protein
MVLSIEELLLQVHSDFPNALYVKPFCYLEEEFGQGLGL